MSPDPYEELRLLSKKARDSLEVFSQLEELSKKLQNQSHDRLSRHVHAVNRSRIDEKALKAFEDHYWTTIKIPGTENEYILVVPKMYDINFGWEIFEDDAWRHFRVNQITNWISDIPDYIKRELNFKEPWDVKIQGSYIVGKDIDKVQEHFPGLVKREGGKLAIKPSAQLQLTIALINQGIMPFSYNPIPKDELEHRPVKFELRDYQKPMIESLMEKSRLTLIIPTGGGKTFIGLAAASEIKPPHIVFCDSRTLIQQWRARIESYTEFSPEEFITMTYQAAIKYDWKGKSFGLKIFDEVQRIPANEFSKISDVPSVATMGMTATPYREDGRESLIIGLSGYPEKISWGRLKDIGAIKLPECHIWVVRKFEEKFRVLEKLMAKNIKTLVYCDSVPLGKQLSARYKIPYIYGDTPAKERLDTIKDNLITFGSRIVDQGLSEGSLRQGIEFDFMGKSQTQSVQRVGRLTHGHDDKGRPVEGIHNIIMTVDEYVENKRRITVLTDNGFRTFHHIDENPETMGLIEQKESQVKVKTPRVFVEKVVQKKEPDKPASETIVDIEKYPMLKYKGIKKIMDSMKERQREFLLFLLEARNKDAWFTTKQLMMALGYRSKGSMHHPEILPFFLKNNYVVKNGDSYKQNFSSIAN